jgi:DNA-directed RNA polymerase specialized sigma24 family protein
MDLETELLRFRPLVTATARRYAGRGAEFDDLVQEGYLALLELIPRCPDRDRLPLFLKRRLPGRVRSAAKREWRSDEQREHSPLEELEGTPSEPAVHPPEIGGEGIAGLLSPAELRTVSLLAEGWSQKEVAERLGVTQQSVSARLRRIREKLSPPER